MIFRNKMISVFTLILVFALYIASSNVQSDRARSSEATTTFSKDSWGLSVVDKYFEERQKNFRFQKPILKSSDLAEFDSLMILSPKMKVSKHEALIIREFVEKGKNLVLTILKEKHFFRVSELFKGLEFSRPQITENEDFENFNPTIIKVGEDSRFFKANEEYSFYSPLKFKSESCNSIEIECFYKELSLGDGKIFLFLGMAPISNVMIGLKDNSKFAERLFAFLGETRIDEYHNFFARKSLSDLFLKWDFSLPLLGIILGTIIFFLFSKPPRDKKLLSSEPPRSFHDLSENILKSLLAKPGWQKAGIDFIKPSIRRLFPHRRKEFFEVSAEISKIQDPQKQIEKWIEVQKEWLKEGRGS